MKRLGHHDNISFKNFDSYKVRDDILLDGVTRKVPIEDEDGTLYLLKFEKEKAGVTIPEHILEFISCKIALALDVDVQNVELGFYKNAPCVKIQMFHTIPTTFGGLGESTLENEDSQYNLDFLLELANNRKLGISSKEYIMWVWKVFSLDMLVGNFDRHENNWGFFKQDDKYYPSPLFDFGSSFYPKINLSIALDMDELLSIQKDNSILLNEMVELLNRYANTDLSPIFAEVLRFDRSQEDRLKFIGKVLDMRVELVRRALDELR